MGIIALVWVNMSSNTTNKPTPPSGVHSASDNRKATVAPKRSNLTRSPVRSLRVPHA